MTELIYPSEFDLNREFSADESSYLFHYTTYSSALGILLSRQMRLGSLANMNDPLEFEDHHGEPIVFHGNAPWDVCSKKISEFENAVTEKEKFVRLASFSMDMPFGNKNDGCQTSYYNNLSKGWARSRMWAQYANNHKGICLIFDKDNLENAFKKEFCSRSCETYCDKVNYTNNLDSLKETLSPPCESLLTEEKIQFMFQKCEDFRDEQEYRLLLINKDLKVSNEVVSFSIADSLCGVIAGTRFPKENRESLKEAIKCSNSKMKFFSISWEYGVPEVTDYTRWLL